MDCIIESSTNHPAEENTMAKLINLEPNKTYATRENAVKAVEKKFGGEQYAHLTYIIHTHTDGRFFPVFLGERAVQAMVHFHFNVAG